MVFWWPVSRSNPCSVVWQSPSSHTAPSCPSEQLLPPHPLPCVPASTHLTWRPPGAWQAYHRISQVPKNRESWPLRPEKWSWSWQHFSTIVWKKNWFISEMVVFAKTVIKSATCDRFTKFKKFWHRSTCVLLGSTPDIQQLALMPHSNAKHRFPLLPPRL